VQISKSIKTLFALPRICRQSSYSLLLFVDFLNTDWSLSSEQMGSYAHICWLQPWGSGLLRYLLCALPGNCSETQKVCHIVSDDVLFLIFCGYAFDTFGTLRLLSETSHPLGKPAPLQLPVEPAVSYAGEEYFQPTRQNSLSSLLKLLNIHIFYYVEILNAILPKLIRVGMTPGGRWDLCYS